MIDAASRIPGPTRSPRLHLIAAGAAFAGIVWIMFVEVKRSSGRGQTVSSDTSEQDDVVSRLVEWREGLADVSVRIVKQSVVVTIRRGDGPRTDWITTNEFQSTNSGAEKVREIRTDATSSGRIFVAINVLTATESQILVVSLLPGRRHPGSGAADSGKVVMRGPRAQRILGFSYVRESGLVLSVGKVPHLKEEPAGQSGETLVRIEGTLGFDPCPWPIEGMYTGSIDVELRP